MTTQSFQRWALKEILLWVTAIIAGYLTFFMVEPLYDRAEIWAGEAGYGAFFAPPHGGILASGFHTRIAGPSLPLRGTITANDPRRMSAHQVVLNANGYGHFQAVAEINGQSVEFMTDTGATYVALSYESAQKLSLNPQNLHFNNRSSTANGVARVASVLIDSIRIGEITVRNVQAVIAEPGRMTQNLLGMSFIRQLSGFELNGSTLTMKE